MDEMEAEEEVVPFIKLMATELGTDICICMGIDIGIGIGICTIGCRQKAAFSKPGIV